MIEINSSVSPKLQFGEERSSIDSHFKLIQNIRKLVLTSWMKNLSNDKGCLWTIYLMLTSLLPPLVELLLDNLPATGQFSPRLDFYKFMTKIDLEILSQYNSFWIQKFDLSIILWSFALIEKALKKCFSKNFILKIFKFYFCLLNPKIEYFLIDFLL